MTTKMLTSFPFVLVIFHLIGLVLFLADPALATRLSWMILLLCGVLVLLSEKNGLKSLPVTAFLLLAGFLLELAGSKTGYVFGNYSYGNSLGTKLYGVPLIIGVNWYVTIVSCSAVVKRVGGSPLLQAVLSGILAVLLDFLIEPVAVKYGFWTWRSGAVPLWNYVCWFLFSGLFSHVYLKASGARNATAFYLFFIWVFFFAVLNLV